MPEGGTVVAGRLGAEALAVAERVTAERGARLLLLGRDFDDPGVPLHPRGAFQRENFAVAVAAAEAFHGPLDPARVRDAAQAVRTPGRLEVVATRAAHDPRRRAQPRGRARTRGGARRDRRGPPRSWA